MQVPGLIKIVALLLIVVCMVAGCGGGMVPSLSGQQPPTPLLGRYSYIPFPSRVPRGKVVFSDRQFPDAVNPFFSGSAVDFEVSAALWAGPIFYDQQFHVHPDQLTEAPVPENGDVRVVSQLIFRAYSDIVSLSAAVRSRQADVTQG